MNTITKDILEKIGVDKNLYTVPNGIVDVSPIDASEIAKVKQNANTPKIFVKNFRIITPYL